MKNRSLIILLSVLGALLLPMNAIAATAYAKVSANIVPLSSFGASSHAVFSELTTENSNKAVVNLSTLGTDSPAKLKVINSNNLAYSISVSHTEATAEPPESLLPIVGSSFTVDEGGLTEKGEGELEFGGTLLMKPLIDNEVRSSPVYITIDFN